VIKLIYGFCSLIASVVLFPFFLIAPRGRKNLSQRYGAWDANIADCIWIHAASYGEVTALLPVVKVLREKFPSSKILFTCMSQTGVEKAGEIADYSYLCPFDNSIWYSKAFKNIQFKTLIITETEIWPAMIEFALKRGASLYLINARISDYTIENYKRLSFVFRPLLNKFRKIVCVNADSVDRFLKLGVKKELLLAGGYSKYDIEPSVRTTEEAKNIKENYFSSDAPVLTLGSIRPGEEEIWIRAVLKAFNAGFEFNLVVAPRHKEKFEFFANKLTETGLNFERYSQLTNQAALNRKIILLDTMGKLSDVYSFSGLAFIGATLVNIGGHNPLEPACYHCAICVGPYYNNIRKVVEDLRNEGGITVFTTSDEAFSLIKMLCEQSAVLRDSGEKAHLFWQKNFGSSARIAAEIEIN
jgi:3-deoxy-D-manno-octulosonic-acid transferase